MAAVTVVTAEPSRRHRLYQLAIESCARRKFDGFQIGPAQAAAAALNDGMVVPLPRHEGQNA